MLNSVILCPPRAQWSDEPYPYSDSNTCKCSSAVHAKQEVSLLYQAFDKWEDGGGMILQSLNPRSPPPRPILHVACKLCRSSLLLVTL